MRPPKIIFITVIFIGLFLFGRLPETIAQDDEGKKYKNISCALSTVHFIPPGFGYGIDVGMPISKTRKISIPIKFSHYTVPHGKYEGDKGYDYPWVLQLASGIKWFKESTPYQKSFQSCSVIFDYGTFDDPKSNAKGSFQVIEILAKWGYRGLIYKRLFLEVSWGIGWMFGKVDMVNKGQTSLGKPGVDGLTFDWDIEIGILF